MSSRNAYRSFPPGVSEKLLSYVYLYYDPNQPTAPFYIGKGIGDRVFAHLHEADKPTRVGLKVGRIRKVWDQGSDVQIRIVRHGLSDACATEIEATLIDLYPDAENEVSGNHSNDRGIKPVQGLASLLMAEEVSIDFPAVVITINKRWPSLYQLTLDTSQKDESEYQKRLYWATRACWSIRPEGRPNCKHVIAYADRLIRQVYKVEQWRQADVDADNLPRKFDKKMLFDGYADPKYAHLVDKAICVEQRPAKGAQNPIRYLIPGSAPIDEPLINEMV